jgi:hypothetical protein
MSTTVVSGTQQIIVDYPNPYLSEIIVVSGTQEIIVDQPESTIAIINAGPQGPPAAGSGFTHNQVSALTTWTINHNLGYNPNVQVFSVGGLEILCEIHHTSINQTTVSFNTATAGSARLS